jgi:hypothetical protein
MTTDTLDDRIAEDDLLPVDDAYAAGLDAVTRIHDDALAAIARIAETWEAAGSPEDTRVVRLAERPAVTQRIEAAAA